MAQMLRKQIYIQERQQLLLRKLAKARGVSEAEIIRQAIEREATVSAAKTAPADASALQAIIQFALRRRKRGKTGEPYSWKRGDAYEDRSKRVVRPV